MQKIVKEFYIYQFDELPKEAQAKAIERYHSINIEYDWYSNIYYEVKQFLKIDIQGFDTGRGSYVNFKLTHDDITKDFLKGLNKYFNDLNEVIAQTEYYLEQWHILDNDLDRYPTVDEIEDILDNTLEVIKSELERLFLKALREEYDYLTSDESIKETLTINEYDFTEDGKIY